VKRPEHAGGKGNAMIAVGGVAGLYLQLTPKGGKCWLLRTTVGAMLVRVPFQPAGTLRAGWQATKAQADMLAALRAVAT
jgi:hypothetical protein